MSTLIPEAWLPNASMKRVIWHWTAGNYKPNATDLKAYHFVVDGDGNWHRGVSVSLNSGSLKDGYAAHTKHCNTGSIGVSLACMAGAVESPFNPGRAPMLKVQMESLIAGTRILNRAYGIPVTRKTNLSHAEVQTTLGIAQAQKWDFTRLPFDASIKGALAIGDMIRSSVAGGAVDDVQPMPAGATLLVAVDTQTWSVPTGVPTGALKAGVQVSLLEKATSRVPFVKVRTPAGYVVYVPVHAVTLVDGPQPQEPTKPDPKREWIAQMRSLLDKLEAEL